MDEVGGARARLADLVDRARRTGGPVYVTSGGRRVAVLVAPEVYDRLVAAAGDAADHAAVLAARADGDFVPWAEVKAELGL